MKNIYDEKGCLRIGLQSMNIWPFYRVEPKVASMQDFYGEINNISQARASSFSQMEMINFNANDYGRVVIQFEEFISPQVKWSLRDSTNMQ